MKRYEKLGQLDELAKMIDEYGIHSEQYCKSDCGEDDDGNHLGNCVECAKKWLMEDIKEPKRVYISGAITGTSDYKERFAKASERIRANGDIPVNPSLLAEILPNGEHHEYMEICMTIIPMCDAIYMIPGWQNSKGATIEYEAAKESGMEIYPCDIAESHRSD